MISKNINITQFKEAIRIAFDNDKQIYSLYCPNVVVNSVDDIVNDISSRIGKDASKATIKGVYEKNELIGYYVYEGKTLISFALGVKHRTRKYLKEFWHKIRSDLKGGFQVYLWSRNRRGYRWLQKNGMKIVAQNDLLTHLIF